MVVLRLLALALAGLILSAAAPGRAQEVDRIAAVVNDDIISIRDLDLRMKLALVMSNLPDSMDNRRRLLPQVMRKMVDEHLQMQEANRVKIQITAEDLARGISAIERQNRMRPGELLASLARAGVDPEAVRGQIRADLAWMRVISRTLQPTIRVGEEEITERLDMLRQLRGQPEYMLAEIVLAVDSLPQEEEARRLGERLIEQLKSGAPFQALARQFSQSVSAGNGGLIGWVNDRTLDEDYRAALARMGKGEVSPLIRTGNGFAILYVADRRIAGEGGGADSMVVYRLVFPKPTGNAPPREQLMAKTREITERISDCDMMEDMGLQLNSAQSGRIGNLRADALPPEIARAVTGLPPRKASPPQDGPDGISVYMVCSGGENSGLPSREQIRRQIEEERVDLLAKRYIRDLRRAAYVDFRL